MISQLFDSVTILILPMMHYYFFNCHCSSECICFHELIVDICKFVKSNIWDWIHFDYQGNGEYNF